MSRIGAAPRAAVPISSARAAASRTNGAKSRGPKTPEGKARAAQNALKHGMRAAKHVVLPDEDAAEFAALEAALFEELAPTGALQAMLARRVAVAAWRLERVDRIETDLFAERWLADGGPGIALIRDGNGTRSFETLLRYRGAAMAEFWRALRTLKALQTEQAAATDGALATYPAQPAARQPLVRSPRPDEPERNGGRLAYATAASRTAPRPDEPERAAGRRLEYVPAEPPAPARTLHEPAAPWLPNQPEPGPAPHAASAPAPSLVPNEAARAVRAKPRQASPNPRPARGAERPPAPARMRATDSQGHMDRLNKCRTNG